jgi:hypothetical protein
VLADSSGKTEARFTKRAKLRPPSTRIRMRRRAMAFLSPDFLGVSLARNGRASASEKVFVKCAGNLAKAKPASVVKNRNRIKNNGIKLARLLKLPSVDKAHPCSKRRRLFKKETRIMTNLETFEYNPEMEGYETGWGAETEWGGEVFSEAESMELAQELLEVTNEAELDRFLGDLISKAGKAIGTVVRSPIGKAVGGWLKGAAKSALPLAGGALGGFIGGPLGAKIGSGLASYAGGALGLEAEMSQEDREFEGAKNFVKMAADAVKSAVAAAPGVNPTAVAKAAVKAAVEKHAPALLGGAAASGLPAGPAGKFGRTGRWVRQGRNVIIVNCG